VVDIGRSELLLPDNEVAVLQDSILLHFRRFRKKSRKKHHVHHAGTEDAATPEVAVKSEMTCMSTGLVYLCAALSVVTVGRQSILVVCDGVLTREKHSGRWVASVTRSI